MAITITAHVRKIGAIGIFYPQTFTVELTCPKCGYTQADQELHGDHRLCDGKIPTANDFKDAWFAQHGDKWELHHFAS